MTETPVAEPVAEYPTFELPATLGMLVALNAMHKHIYQGTVPAHVKARRRRINKAARLARRATR